MTKISQLHQKWLEDPEYKNAYEEMAIVSMTACKLCTNSG